MATRSTILAKLSDGKFKKVYCHNDGYLSHNGRILLAHYNDQEAVDELLFYGDMSQLAERTKPDASAVHSFDQPQRGVCVFYGRDRGELRAANVPSFATAGECDAQLEDDEFNYAWDGECWSVRCGTHGPFQPLETELKKERSLK